MNISGEQAHLPIALSMAGLDPVGGAGVIADLRAFEAHDVYGTAIITTLTAQNSSDMGSRLDTDTRFLNEQVRLLFEDVRPQAVKTGAIGNEEIISEVLYSLAEQDYSGPLVVDPVILTTGGSELVDAPAVEALRRVLLPRATVITPNIREASILASLEIFDVDDMATVALRLASMGAASVLITGGKDGDQAVDILFNGNEIRRYSYPWIGGASPHGTGCLLSAAICALMAAGKELEDAVEGAREYVHRSITGRFAPGARGCIANPFQGGPATTGANRTGRKIGRGRGRKN